MNDVMCEATHIYARVMLFGIFSADVSEKTPPLVDSPYSDNYPLLKNTSAAFIVVTVWSMHLLCNDVSSGVVTYRCCIINDLCLFSRGGLVFFWE